MVISIGKALVHGAFLLAGTGIGFGIKMIFDHWKYDCIIPPEDKDGKDAFEKAYAYYKAKKAGVISPENAPNTASNGDIKEYIDEKFERLKEVNSEYVGGIDTLIINAKKAVLDKIDVVHLMCESITKDVDYVAQHMNRIRNIEKMCECMTTDQLESIMDDISEIKTVLKEVNLIEEEDYVNAAGGISGIDRDEELQDRGSEINDIRAERMEGERDSSSEDCERIQGSDRSVGEGEDTAADRAERVEGEGDGASGGSGRVQSSTEEKEEADGGRIMNDDFEDYDQMPYEESPEDRETRQQQPAYEISEEEYEAESGPGEPYRFKDDDFTYYLQSDVLATGNDIQDADEILTPEGHHILRMCNEETTCYIRLEAIDTDFQIEVLDEEWPGD